MYSKLKIFSGRSNEKLAKEICSYLGIELSNALVTKFADGECRVKIQENARGTDSYVIQSTSPPVNQNIMELVIMIDALKRASAKRITAVIPYFGYARQDRKDTPRVPITAKLVANILQVAGANRVLVVDIHAQQIQGFFDCPVDNLLSLPVIIAYLKKKKIKNLTVVAPDSGGVGRASQLAKKMRAPLAVVDKRRSEPNVAKVYHIIGNVKGRNAIIVDDIVDTAGTLKEVSKAIKKAGAENVYAACTHGLFSGTAVEKIKISPIKELLTTDTIRIPKKKLIPKIKVLTVSTLLGEAIKRIHEETSVSDLFI
ncbi:MAG: ribose-phosphate pyrophosphokinase [Elusimicrobiota bacterium]